MYLCDFLLCTETAARRARGTDPRAGQQDSWTSEQSGCTLRARAADTQMCANVLFTVIT